jgi:hypothetical protein
MGLAPSGNGENPGKSAVAKVPVPIFSQPRPVYQVGLGGRSNSDANAEKYRDRPIRRGRPEIACGWPARRFAFHLGHVDQAGSVRLAVTHPSRELQLVLDVEFL